MGTRVPLDSTSLRALAAVLECVGGPMLMAGLFTRPLAFLLSGEMAFAYFMNHAPEGFWGSFIEPNQEAAILNCFLFLFLWAAGPGAWSLDGLRMARFTKGRSMGIQKQFARVVAVAAFVLLPGLASAQSSIVGVVRDASGGVLPGVTVEAASPALIEKVRSVITDEEGRYRIVDLRPGPYTVTFTLTGFSTVRREGIELPRRVCRHGECRHGGRRDRGDADRHRRGADRRYAELSCADAVRTRDARSASRHRTPDDAVGGGAGRDADAGIQPRRRRHERSHPYALQRPRRPRGAADHRRHEPAAAEFDAGRRRVQPVGDPGSRARDERHRRRSRQRRHGDQHDSA